MLKFSVIVPVYNTPFEVYKECIDSIVSCLNNSDEMIIVDDGSSVECYQDYKTYISNINNVLFIRTENKGVSSARNTGLSYVNGDYIIFVDSDDMLVNNSLNELRNMLKKNPVDILCFESFKGKKYYPDNLTPSENIIFIDSSERYELIDAAFLYSKKYNYLGLNTIWGKAYKKELITDNRLKFPVGLKRMEDVMFNIDFLKYISRIAYYNRVYYFYRTGSSFSTVNSFQDEYLERFSTVFLEFEKKYSSDGIIKRAILYKEFKIIVDYISNHIFNQKFDLSQVRKQLSCIKDSLYGTSINLLKYSNLISKKEYVYLFLLKRRQYGIVYTYCYLKKYFKK